MPSTDSFSDSRYGQSYEHDHEDHYDHDTSHLNTGINFGNLGTGSLISELEKIENPDDKATHMIQEHKSFSKEDKDRKTRSEKYGEWCEKTLAYLTTKGYHTEKPPKPPQNRKKSAWLEFVRANENLHSLEDSYPQQINKTAYNNWKQSVKDACEHRHVELPDNLKPRERKASEPSQTPKKPRKSKAKSSTSNQVTTNATAGLIHFTVHEHVGADGLPAVTIKMKPNHPHHHHPKPQ